MLHTPVTILTIINLKSPLHHQMKEPHMQISELQLLKDLKIKHVMVDTEEGSSIDIKSTVTEALSLMAKDPNSAVVISVENGDIVGIATEKDVILALEKFGPSVLERTIETIMTSDPVRSDMETTCETALQQMIDGNFRNIPVFENEKFKGIVQALEIAEGKSVEILEENRKLKELIEQHLP